MCPEEPKSTWVEGVKVLIHFLPRGVSTEPFMFPSRKGQGRIWLGVKSKARDATGAEWTRFPRREKLMTMDQLAAESMAFNMQ